MQQSDATALNSILPAGSYITTVDKQTQQLSVEFIKANFEKDELPLTSLDGILMANSFHYIRDKQKLIKKLETYFSASPTFLIVEYDTTRLSLWVSYPINFQNLHQLFSTLRYGDINKLSEMPSCFGGRLYSALIRL